MRAILCKNNYNNNMYAHSEPGVRARTSEAGRSWDAISYLLGCWHGCIYGLSRTGKSALLELQLDYWGMEKVEPGSPVHA